MAGRVNEIYHSISCVGQRRGINLGGPWVPSGIRYLLRNIRKGERLRKLKGEDIFWDGTSLGCLDWPGIDAH